MSLNALTTINCELTSLCDKGDGTPGSGCWMCGRRKVERDYPELALKYGNMEFSLIEKIALQLPRNITVQFHRDGESLLYPRFGDAVALFKSQIRNIVTNGKLLVVKANEIIDNLDTLSLSIFEGDVEAEEQYRILEEFLNLKGDKKPMVTLRLIGDVDSEPYRKFNLLFIKRVLHSEMGSFNYKREPVIPEVGICWDFLSHPCIGRDGKMSICVRFDPKGLGVIGDLNKQSIDEIWNGDKRMEWLEYHKRGRRDKIPLCSYCQYWGVPVAP